jgi:protein TonB
MFDTLIEAQPRKPKTAKQFVLSIVVHTILITGAVYGTLQARERREKPAAEILEFAQMKPEEHPHPKQPERVSDVVAVSRPPRGFQLLISPIEIPDMLPRIDLSKRLTDDSDFSGTGVEGGVGRGVESARSGDTFRAFEVERQVVAASGNPPPRYPDMLRSANVEGEVLAQFVVDTRGRVDMITFRVLRSSHELFTSAVRQHLSVSRYYPAEIGGQKVKQLVQQTFNFALTK